MRKPWTLIGMGMLLAALAVATIGCGGGSKKDTSATQTAAYQPPQATQTAVETSQPTAETPAPGAEIAPITMNEVNGSGVTGSATITETGVNVAVASPGHTQVVVTIDGGLDPGSHLSHIHEGGTCATQPQGIYATLTNVEAGADGAGIALTSDPVPAAGGEPPPFSYWLASAHYVGVHALNGDLVSCGDVVAAE